MSLGYALLHQNRIQIALDGGSRKKTYDDLTDFAFGVMGVGDLGSAANDFAQDTADIFSRLVEDLRTEFTGEDSLLGFFQGLIEELSSMANVGETIGDFLGLLGQLNGSFLREKLHQWVDRLCAALPAFNGQEINRYLETQIASLTTILEQPIRSGRRDVAAHRSCRAAVTLRQLIGEGLAEAPWASANFDVKSILCQVLHQAIADISDEMIAAFSTFAQTFQADYSGLINASFGFSASASISTGDGPQGMADGVPSWRDEIKAVSHPSPGSIWGVDLGTNILATFFSIWESVRTGNYADRPVDGILSVVTILWQTAHTIIRAAWPNEINRDRGETDNGKIFLNWLFTDQGNFSVNLLLRLFQSFHEAKHSSNWALSFAQRLLKYFTYVTNVRSIYYFTRSVWYFKDRAANRRADEPEQVSLNRILWTIWGPMSWLSTFLSFFLAWDDFTLENGWTARTISLLVISIVVGLVGGYIILWQIAGESPFQMSVSADWWTMGLVLITWVLAVIGLIIILLDLESGSKGAAVGGFVAFAVLIVYGMVGLPIVFGQDNGWEHFFLQSFIIFSSLLIAGVLPFFLWWFYIDDGRDKHSLFEGKDPETSPYRLPYPRDENWLCGQGVHGIFSHIPVDVTTNDDNDNHYAYDFNEYENKSALAARGGIILEVRRNNPNNGDNQNSIDVQHVTWQSGHDPGSDDERVLTYSTYIHLSQNRVWAMVGHRFVQGYHLADIDNTGRSAQHHLHFHAEEVQRRVDGGARNMTLPVVFQDDSTRRFRNFPFLAWVPGKGHIPGKPLSMAFYTSDNGEQPPHINPIEITLAQAGATAHTHTLAIDRRVVENGPLPTSLTLVTSVEQQHFHTITVDRSQLETIARLNPPAGLTVSTVNGHAHGLTDYNFIRLGTASQPTLALAEPPRGQLFATNPGPYQLLGDQLVVRVNERTTEYFFYGAIRPHLRGELALDRGLAAADAIDIGTGGTSFNVGGTSDLTVLGTVNALNGVFRTGASPLDVEIRVEPVIVIETLTQGQGAALQVAPSSSPALVTPGVASGSGAANTINQMTPAQLAAHFGNVLQNGWDSPPGAIAAQVVLGNWVALTLGGSAIAFPNQNTRNSRILTQLYDSSNSRLRATGTIPFSRGRIPFTSTYSVPVLGTAAQVQIDTSHSAFSGAALIATPLEVTVRGRTYSIELVAGDNAPATLARKIALRAEGVRAWASGANQVTVQTVAAGQSIQLEVRKSVASGTAFQQQNSGSAPTAITGGIADSCALTPTQLRDIITDGVGRATLPYNAATVLPQAQMDGNVLVLRVASGHTLSVSHVQFSGGQDPFGFTQAQDSGGNDIPTEVRSAPLASTVALNAPGWVEVTIDGTPVLIPFDGEPARLELGPMERLPASGESLTLSVNGGANVTLSFSGNEGGVSAVAEAIAQQFSDVSVRIAYVLSFENDRYDDLPHTLQLNDAPGLALAGFLADRSGYTTTEISVGTDHLAIPANLTGPERDRGLPVNPFTLTEAPPNPTGNITWDLTVEAGLTLTVTATPTDDPLGFTGGGSGTLSTAAIPAALALPHPCQRYTFDVLSGTNTIARSRLQMAAAPAAVRANGGLAGPLPSDPNLPLTVIEPNPAGTTITHAFSVNLAGVSALDEVVHRLNGEVPAIRAWNANNRLHIETRGHGNGWQLRLENPLLLLSLGFDGRQINLTTGQLEVSGGGDIRDGRGATHAEIRAALQRIGTCATLLNRASGIPQSLQIERTGTHGLTLRSQEGPVIIETEPTWLKQALHVTEASNIATINPPNPTVALDCGTIIIRAGGRSVAVFNVFADHATVVADEPLPPPGDTDETRQLNELKNQPLLINGVSVGPLAASVSTLRDAIAWYSERLPGDVWLGLNSDDQVVFQSRPRGNVSLSLEIDFTNFVTSTFNPGDTLLGFVVAPSSGGNVWQFTATGEGNVRQLDAVPVWSTSPASLEGFLNTAAQQGGSRQAIFDIEVDRSAGPDILRARANLTTQTLQQPALPAPPGPGGIRFGGSGQVITANYSLITPVRPGELNLKVAQGGITRDVISFISGTPARLDPLTFPTSLASLNGKGFAMTITSGMTPQTFNIAFSGITSEQQVATQVERQCQWQVRANVATGTLVIETIARGSALSIRLANPTSGIPSAVTNNLATGFRAGSATSPTSLPLAAQAGGTVPDLANITAEQYRDALLSGFITETTAIDDAARGSRTLNWQAYEVGTGTPNYFTLISQRNGCMSAVEPIVRLIRGLTFTDNMAQAPAIHGSVVLPLPEVSTSRADTFNLPAQGVLTLEFNNNTKGTPPQPIEDLPARTTVAVTFPAGDYTAQNVARRIHEELFNRGAGQAAAYPDGTVVVETAVPGLAGSVKVPAPGTGTSGSDQALLQKLLGTTPAEVERRGWPGVGFGNPGDALRPGFRSANVTTAQANALWTFTDSTSTPAAIATVTVTTGQTIADIQRAVDDALRAPTGSTNRIGLCLLGPDGTLYIEGMTANFTLAVTVNGRVLATQDPGPNEPGKTPEREVEPAVGLRRTHEIRTFRYGRDFVGHGNSGNVDDLGWIRLPAFANSLPANFDDRKGSPAMNLRLPPGRFLMAARADAAKTRDYDATGEMIASAGTDPNEANRHFVRQARYWMSFNTAATLGVNTIVRSTGSGDVTDYLVDFLWGG